jgi:hypothetical protein
MPPPIFSCASASMSRSPHGRDVTALRAHAKMLPSPCRACAPRRAPRAPLMFITRLLLRYAPSPRFSFTIVPHFLSDAITPAFEALHFAFSILPLFSPPVSLR